MSQVQEVYVAGNPLVTRRGDTYGGARKCGDDSCDTEVQDRRVSSPEDAELLVVHPQGIAVSETFRRIKEQVKKLLSEKFDQNPSGMRVISDPYAIPDIARTGRVDDRFVSRFQKESGKSLSETGSLLSDIATELKTIKSRIALTIQLDQSGSLHHYLADGAEARLGRFLRDEGFIYDASDDRLTLHRAKELLEGFGWDAPKKETELRELIKMIRLVSFSDGKPLGRVRVKRALSGAAGRFVPLPLTLFKPEIFGLLASHIDGSIFKPEEITVEPERVIRDGMSLEALRLSWEHPDEVNYDKDGIPYHNLRNAFTVDSKGRLGTRCLGVVAGTFVRLASRYPSANVHYVMEEDLRNERVADAVVRGGIRLFEEKWLIQNPHVSCHIDYEMVKAEVSRI